MPVSAARKSATRDRIVQAAGRAFRRDGFAATRLGEVMAEAGMTHGGFYAHFPSKAALFAEVAREDHAVLTRLRKAEGLAARTAVLEACLDPERYEAASAECTLSALGADAARQGGAAAQGIARAFEGIAAALEEVGARPGPARAATALAVGAMGAARALPQAERRRMLEAAQAEVSRMLRPARKGRGNAWGFGD